MYPLTVPCSDARYVNLDVIYTFLAFKLDYYMRAGMLCRSLSKFPSKGTLGERGEEMNL